MRTLMIVLLLLLSCYSCKKKVKGCMDGYATNYNEEAVEDDGSCEPYGIVHFWFALGYTVSRVTINSETHYDHNDYNVLYRSEPSECGRPSSGLNEADKSGIVFVLPPGQYDYVGSTIDAPDTFYYQTGTITIIDGNCELIEIK